MLSKTKESEKTLLKDFWQLSRAGSEYVVGTATLSKSSVVYVEITNITFTAANVTGYICFWVNGGNIFGMTNATSNGNWSPATPANATALSWVLPAGTFQVYLQSNNSSNSILATVKAYTIDYTMVPYGANLYPKEIKEIWEQAITILYGNNDKDFIGGIMLNEDTKVTTWNIAPSNYVWYIKVLFNGKYIKIPYYND